MVLPLDHHLRLPRWIIHLPRVICPVTHNLLARPLNVQRNLVPLWVRRRRRLLDPLPLDRRLGDELVEVGTLFALG
jgi:hypothetical protein